MNNSCKLLKLTKSQMGWKLKKYSTNTTLDTTVKTLEY